MTKVAAARGPFGMTEGRPAQIERILSLATAFA
jgi:hypothetical protein